MTMEQLDVFPMKIISPLSMLRFRETPGDDATTPLLFNHLVAKGIIVDFLIGEFSASDGMSIVLCVSKDRSVELLRELCRSRQLARAEVVAVETPVSIIRILGAHFDIRPGILAFLMDSVLRAGIQVFATSTTITSSLLVIPETQLQPTLRLLREIFRVPGED